MLLQFCHYHIQNYRLYKQGEQTNLRTNRDSSGGKGGSHQVKGSGFVRGAAPSGGGLLLLALPFNPSLLTALRGCWTLLHRSRDMSAFLPVQFGKGYLRSSSNVLMEELLLSPRQLSSSNYLLWVPPRAKLSLGFVSPTSNDLPEESSAIKPASPCSLH